MDRLLKRLCVLLHFTTHVAGKYDAKRSPPADRPRTGTSKPNAPPGKQTFPIRTRPRANANQHRTDEAPLPTLRSKQTTKQTRSLVQVKERHRSEFYNTPTGCLNILVLTYTKRMIINLICILYSNYVSLFQRTIETN